MHENEYVDVYDEAMKYIGTESKASVHLSGSWHKSIHCWIIRKDQNAEYLLFQKRSYRKRLVPGYYDVTVAGHFEAGESSKDAIREVDEEVGLHTLFEDWTYLGIKIDVGRNEQTVNREFSEIFIINNNQELREYTLCANEVDALVQIKIADGLDLFSGRKNKIQVEGIKYNEATNSWEWHTTEASVTMFIPRVDPYYLKMFVIARRFFDGEKDLYI